MMPWRIATSSRVWSPQTSCEPGSTFTLIRPLVRCVTSSAHWNAPSDSGSGGWPATESLYSDLSCCARDTHGIATTPAPPSKRVRRVVLIIAASSGTVLSAGLSSRPRGEFLRFHHSGRRRARGKARASGQSGGEPQALGETFGICHEPTFIRMPGRIAERGGDEKPDKQRQPERRDQQQHELLHRPGEHVHAV